jgi:hypothetical protein
MTLLAAVLVLGAVLTGHQFPRRHDRTAHPGFSRY